MFPKERRLRKSADIILVLRKGRRYKVPALTCYFLAKPGTLGRVGVIVDTKVSKKAVVRNLLKRRIRTVLESNGIPEGDLVIRVAHGAAETTFEELSQQLGPVLKSL